MCHGTTSPQGPRTNPLLHYLHWDDVAAAVVRMHPFRARSSIVFLSASLDMHPEFGTSRLSRKGTDWLPWNSAPVHRPSHPVKTLRNVPQITPHQKVQDEALPIVISLSS